MPPLTAGVRGRLRANLRANDTSTVLCVGCHPGCGQFWPRSPTGPIRATAAITTEPSPPRPTQGQRPVRKSQPSILASQGSRTGSSPSLDYPATSYRCRRPFTLIQWGGRNEPKIWRPLHPPLRAEPVRGHRPPCPPSGAVTGRSAPRSAPETALIWLSGISPQTFRNRASGRLISDAPLFAVIVARARTCVSPDGSEQQCTQMTGPTAAWFHVDTAMGPRMAGGTQDPSFVVARPPHSSLYHTTTGGCVEP